MTTLSRIQAIALLKEQNEGVYSTPFSSAIALTDGGLNYQPIDPSIDFSPTSFTRNVKRGTLTPAKPLTGTRPGTMRFGLEFCGTGSIARPQISWPLQACGFREENLTKFTIGAVTGGPFKHGERITQTGTSAVLTVVGDTYTGMTTLWAAKGNGLGNGTAPNGTGLLTGATSGATATPSAVTATDAGWGYWSNSVPLSKLTLLANISNTITNGTIIKNADGSAWGQVVGDHSAATTTTMVIYRRRIGHFQEDDVITTAGAVAVGTLIADAATANIQQVAPTVSCGMMKDGVRESMRGARGTVNFSGNIGEPFIATFELSGAYQAVTDAAVISPTAGYNQSTPPTLLGANVSMGESATTYAGEYLPCISQIGIDVGNTVSPRRCMSDASGISEFHITGRQGTVTIDPDLEIEGVWDYVNQFLSNESQRLRFQVGSSVGNMFYIQLPNITYTQMPTGDRDGFSTRAITGSLDSGAQNSSSGDNEIVVIYPVV